MRVTLEFFGVARLRAEVSQLVLEFEAEELPLGEVLAAAGRELPQWADTCLQGTRLAPGYLANIDGEAFVRDPLHHVRHGQTVLILAADAGG